MINKIIVPLDGSQLAEVALPYAEENAGRLGADMLLVTVREPRDERSQYMLECYLEKMAEVAKTGASKYLAKGAKPITVTRKVLSGSSAEEIVSLAEHEEGSKIVMATHGQSGFTRWALGSVADKVIRATIRPVTVIRAQGAKPAVHEKGYLNRILAPIDLSKESEVVLPYLEEFASALKAEVTFLHVLKRDTLTISTEALELAKKNRESAERQLAKLAQRLNKKGIAAKSEVVETIGDISDEINRYTKEHYTDSIVMATHGRSGPRRWVLGSVANKVLREGNTPLTLIRTTGPFKD